ncbi:MAG: ribonuclease P protein component [Minisyncoccia bacterium]
MRQRRLGRGDFERVRGARAVSSHFSLSFSRVPGHGGYAAVVSKKVATKAVVRHRLKRWMLESMRPWSKPGRGLILYARAGAGVLPRKVFLSEVQILLQSAFLNEQHH